MKAVVWTAYGPPDLLQVRDTPIPTPADDDVLIRVRATSINPFDWHMMRGEPFPTRLMSGLRSPKLQLGRDVAGVVETVGAKVTEFKPGDEVFGCCRGGAFAEYVCSPTKLLAPKPTRLTFEEAGAVGIAGFTALIAVRDKGQVRAGQRVLINGAAGGVGTFAVQIAQAQGAELTAVCSTTNVDLVRSLGADHVVDYTRDDFTAGSARYDVILDNVSTRSLAACRRVLKPGGIHVAVGALSMWRIATRLLAAPIVSRLSSKRLVPAMVAPGKSDLLALSELLETGTVRPAIDRVYPLVDIVEAMRYVETGHARAKVVMTVV